MKTAKTFPLIFIFSLILISFYSCSQSERPVVPYDTEADAVFKRLSPNEEDAPEGLTFGKDSIPGVIFDYEMSTNDSDIYVFFDKFTLLDINPEINQDIVEFIYSHMSENDFLTSAAQLPYNVFSNLVASGVGYQDAMTKVLDMLRIYFEAGLASRSFILPPFHMYFMIYPVYLDDNYITYRLYASCFTGGAHGIPYSYLRTYDLNSGKLLTLKDIVKPEGLKDVREEVAAHMAYSYPIYENITTVNQYIDSLNKWLDHFDPMDITGKITIQDFPLSDPAITSEGLAFIYSVYELTPGSDGCPLVVIPYRDIKGCLYPQFEW